MSFTSQLEEAQSYLSSHRLIDRKRSLDLLIDILRDETVVECLNQGEPFTWDMLLRDVQTCLKKECDRVADAISKKGPLKAPDKSVDVALQLFGTLVKLAVAQGEESINISTLTRYIEGCFLDKKMRLCRVTFLQTLKECVLSNPNCLGCLDPADFISLFRLLKTELEKGQLTDSKYHLLVFSCISLLLKHGPLSAFPACFLREQFKFFSQLCQSVNRNDLRDLQEFVVEITLNFCKHTAEDNRLSCILLGEEVFISLLNLYCASGHDSILKVNIIEFSYLLVTLHHPGGALEGSAQALAANWHNWKVCLTQMYSILTTEISQYLRQCVKNTNIFITKDNITVILTSFVMLFVEVCKQLFSERNLSLMSCSSSDSIELDTQVKKKRKIDASLEAFIAEIQDTKSWVWVKLVGALVKQYPDLIHESLYINFLQILHILQLEVKDSLTISYIYEVLSILLDIEDRLTFDKSSEIEVLWRLVGESTLRAVGLNQNVKETQGLLQRLIKRNVVDLGAVMQTFTSGVLTITEYHLLSLQLVLKRVNFSQLEVSRREDLMNCLLNGQNVKDFNCLLKPAFAEVLVALTLKQCPDFVDESELRHPNQYHSLVNLYSKSCFEPKDFKGSNNQKTAVAKRSFNLNQETLVSFLQKLQSFAEFDDLESTNKMLCIVGLLYHIVSFMVDFEVVQGFELQNHQVVVQIERILNKLCLKRFEKYHSHNDKLLKELLDVAQVLDEIFSIKNCVTSLMKELFPLEFLRGIVGILHYFQNVSKQKIKLEHDLKKALVGALSKYGLVSNVGEPTQNQKFIVLVLSKPDYDFRNHTDYELSMTFLTNICHASPGFLSSEELSNILECLRGLCSAMYHNYGCVLKILQLIKEVYQHLPYTDDTDYKTAAVQLLFVFYNRRLLYGPDVSVALLDCIEKLYKADPDCVYSFWDGKEIIKYVPEYLASDFQKVRYRAVDVLVGVLNSSVWSTKIKTIHRMEELFDSMFNWSVKVFEVEGELTTERRHDEILFRASSALYTFVSVIVNCNSWIEESLFAIIRLDYSKKLCNISDGELIKKVFAVLRYHFNSENFMEKYADNLLTNWLSLGYDINSFECRLLDCNDKIDLYMKYFDICLPLLLSTDKIALLDAASRLNMNETQVLERCCTDIFGRALSKEVHNLGPNFMERNRELSYCCQILGVRLREILVSRIDQVLLSLIRSVTDERVLANVFGENVLFKIKGISLSDLKKCLDYVQTFLCNDITPIDYLIKNKSSTLQQILLKLQLKTCLSESDYQLKFLHQYTIFLDLVMESIPNTTFITFLFRDTTYFLIHLTTRSKDLKIRRATLKYLNTFLKNNLPKYSIYFEQLLIFTVNSLKSLSIQYNELSSICLDSIEFLVITHNEAFQDTIMKLDAFPLKPEYNLIRQVQDKQDANLEQKIRNFLECDDFATRADGLRHLKYVLATKKNEVSELYDALRKIRGFSEDSENSLPHRLISMLIKLSCYPKESISLEAVKCLGELGPADLTTIVLEPEKKALDVKYPPYEMFTGYVMTLLVQFIVDENIEVVKAASEALYEVFCFRESKKVMDHDHDFGYGPINKQFIAPYLCRQQRSLSKLKTDDLKVADLEANTEFWCPSNKMDNHQWITTLVVNLLDTFDTGCYLKKLIPLCKVKAKFCELIFPRLIYLMVSLGNKRVTKALSGQLKNFFQVHWNSTQSETTSRLICVNKKSVKCMLDVANFVRQQPILPNSKTNLELNYLLIAKAAVFCSAHFSALLYTELWCQEKISEFSSKKLQDGTFEHGYSLLDLIYESEPEEITNVLQQILQVSYKSIGELDALSGCGISLLLRPEHRVEYYKNTGQWKHVMDYYCVNPMTEASHKANLIKSFKMNHLYQLPLLCETTCAEPEYECLWRLGQWNLNKKEAVRFTEVNPADYEKYHFVCLKALRDQDLYTFNEAKQVLNMCITDQLRHTSLESSKSLYPILTQLQSLVEMDDCLSIKESSDFDRIRDKWRLQDEIIRKNDFQFVEPVVAQRMTMLGEMVKSFPDLRDDYFNLVLDVADYARDEGYIRVAENALIKLKKIPNLDQAVENQLQFREAQLAWLNGDKMIAQQLLRKLCNSDHIDPRLKAAGFMLQGVYMVEMYSDRRTVLNSFELALQIYKNIRCSLTADDYKKLYDAYDTIATFADKEYQQTMSHIKSDLFQKKLSNIKSCKDMAEALSVLRNLTEDQRKAQVINKRQICIDENEVMAVQKSKDIVLELAVKHYVKNLQESDSNNIKIFRIMSLFLENRDNKPLMDQLKNMVLILPTYKYITMLPQLIPHITTNQQDLFGQQVNVLIETCALYHPHHTIPLLLALVNANKDKEYSKKTKVPPFNERSLTAAAVIKKLRNKVELKGVVDKMLVLSEALIELAYYVDSNGGVRNEVEIPAGLKLRKIKAFDDILVPTYSLPVSKNNRYDNIVGINRFLPKYKTVGGINAPKRIECRCTNGKLHSQLVKGQDDLRQDAVMQQVFTIMTDLLSANKQTKNLLIRTYKVVPLSMRSGILEWVANSMPIGEYLTGSLDYVGAHKEFRPKDKTPTDCRIKFKGCQGKPFEEKLMIYKSICKDFQPVFHKFFDTYFRQPSVWYERRRAYIHSVATTSMCGYVLGIGDRHVSNILIDKHTAEVVHIDFGIAFEQGKCLPTPETVPFRLSRDIVDGMGVSGVEGLFRKSCEKTMEVLRCNSQVIVTILEVLLYDPLYFWTVSAAEANKRQTEEEGYSRTVAEDTDEENKNVSAQRALLRLRSKLEGTEDGKSTSVEQQVGTLIQQAMDPSNLCKLFYGWQPYL